MLTVPVFKSCYEVAIVDQQHALVLGERGNRLLNGSAYVIVAGLLGQGKSVDEIVEAAEDRLSIAEVYYALECLETMGLIREAGNDGLPHGAEGFWDAIGADTAVASRAIHQSTVELQSMGDVCTQELARALEGLGVKTGPAGDFCIALVDDYLHPGLAAFNQNRLRDERPWMLARPLGSFLWLGPLLRPGSTACWECMAHRMRGLRVAESFVQRQRHGSHPRAFAAYALPSTELAAAGLIATEIVKSLCGAPALEGALVTLDLSTMATQRHEVIRRPQCAACGEGNTGSQRPPNPIRLSSRPKRFTSEGYRSATPEETLESYGRHISRLTGVVSELTATPGVDQTVVPMWYSGMNSARRDDTIDSLRNRFRGISAGKGKTGVQAKAGALCEAIERRSGVFQGDEVRVRGSFASIGDAAMHPHTCLLFSDTQYARRQEISPRRSSHVPAPFDEQMEIEWSPLWSLTQQRFRYLPTAYCYYDYEPKSRTSFCWPDSNGCAAGNSLEEAILQGFLELVERDSIALWWYNRVRRPAVDLTSFDEPYFAQQQSYYRSLGREIWVLDITADLGIPAFAAVSRRTNSPTEDITFGFGCHLDPRLGVLRALTEANQMLPMVIDRSINPTSTLKRAEDEVLSWLDTATTEEQSYVVPDEGSSRAACDYRQYQHDDLSDDVELCVNLAAEHGMETLVLDQTRPDIGLSVVRVVVPGLRHFWARFAPGRLYDVPVSLGWLASPVPEANLNPISLFF